MSAHEPECLLVATPCKEHLVMKRHDEFPIGIGECVWCDVPCSCNGIRAAYQRGREDAAKAVFAAIPPAPIMGSGEITQFRVEDIINAARGDGKQG